MDRKKTRRSLVATILAAPAAVALLEMTGRLPAMAQTAGVIDEEGNVQYNADPDDDLITAQALVYGMNVMPRYPVGLNGNDQAMYARAQITGASMYGQSTRFLVQLCKINPNNGNTSCGRDHGWYIVDAGRTLPTGFTIPGASSPLCPYTDERFRYYTRVTAERDVGGAWGDRRVVRSKKIRARMSCAV